MLIIGRCFQPFERIELIELFKHPQWAVMTPSYALEPAPSLKIISDFHGLNHRC